MGGRLASYAGSKVLALTRTPEQFTFGPHPSDPEQHDKRDLISARNTRKFALYEPADDVPPLDQTRHITRSLRSYYAALK